MSVSFRNAASSSAAAVRSTSMASQSSSVSPTLGNTSRPSSSAVWVIVGASRGIGLEFVRQLLLGGHRVYAVIRDPASASHLWSIAGTGSSKCELLQCDVTDEESIQRLAQDLTARKHLERIDYVVLNAGILKYPNRATETYAHCFRFMRTFHSPLRRSFASFAAHLHTNTIGPIITAQALLATKIPIINLVFMSSDSGSTTSLRHFEDGFATYAASKAALNQALRHLAAELQMKRIMTTVLALHPGEVATERVSGSTGSELEGLLTTEQSVHGMLNVIQTKDIRHTGTFWTWDGKIHPW